MAAPKKIPMKATITIRLSDMTKTTRKHLLGFVNQESTFLTYSLFPGFYNLHKVTIVEYRLDGNSWTKV